MNSKIKCKFNTTRKTNFIKNLNTNYQNTINNPDDSEIKIRNDNIFAGLINFSLYYSGA